MIKNLAIAIGGLILIAIVFGWWSQYKPAYVGTTPGPYYACTAEAKICPDGTAVGRTGPHCEFAPCPSIPVATDYKNATYILGGEPVVLVNGKSSMTQIFGTPTMGDLDGDGIPDAAFILVQNPGGSGTFYYVVVALTTPTGVRGTNGLLLGDRIAPQTVEIRNGIVIANFADRGPTDSFVTPPSIGVSKYARVINGTLTEVSQPTAGEGTVTGRVTLSPTCPVERIPPDPQCAPKGYATTVTATAGTVVAKALSDTTGAFTLSLKPGVYILTAKGGNTLPRCESQTLTVHAGSQTLDISCDTGIR